jgi:succinate-acetate transporter protein
MGLLSLVFLICSLRTNVAFFIIFLTLTIAFGLLTGAYWAMAEDFTGNAHFSHKLIVVSTISTLPWSKQMKTC